MALIALAADKGSPGVTTSAVALSAVWPRRALLAEVDTAGGDLVYRSANANGGPLDPNTGMLSLAATARRGLAAEQLWDHSQRLHGGLDVLVGLGNADQSTGLAGQWGTLGKAFASLGESPHAGTAADVLADCGRIGPDSPSVALFEHAALVLLVTRAEPGQIARVRDRASALSGRLHDGQGGARQLGQPLVGVLVIADESGAGKVGGQVNEMLVASRAGAHVMGVIAQDAAGAEQLAGRRRGRVEKSLLVRSVRKVVSDLHQQYGAAWAANAAGPVSEPVPQPPPAAAQTPPPPQPPYQQPPAQQPSAQQAPAQPPGVPGRPEPLPPQQHGPPPGYVHGAAGRASNVDGPPRMPGGYGGGQLRDAMPGGPEGARQ